MAKKFSVFALLRAENRASQAFAAVDRSVGSLAGRLDRFVITSGDVTRAARAVVAQFGQWVEAANEAEKAEARRATALEKSGDLTEELVGRLNRQADALQGLSDVTADQVVAQQAFLASMGVSGDQLEEAVQAALDLSKALDIDFGSAVRNVGKTVGGFAGELGEVIPELKELDQSALRAGEGITLLAEKFAGTAAKEGQTLAVQLQGLRNDADDLGKVLAQSLFSAIGDAAGGMDELRDRTRELRPEVEAFGTGLGVITAKLIDLATAQGEQATAGDKVLAFLSNFVVGVPRLIASIGEWKIVTDAQKQAEAELAAQLEFASAAMNEQTKAIDGLVISSERLSALRARELRLEREANQVRAETTALAKELGVTLEADVVAAKEAEAEATDKVSRALELGVITYQDYQRLLEASREKVEELTAAQEAGLSTVERTAVVYEEAATGLGLLEERATGARERFAELNGELERAEERTERLNRSGVIPLVSALALLDDPRSAMFVRGEQFVNVVTRADGTRTLELRPERRNFPGFATARI